MDYKEKVIALLNSQELSKEQKEKLENIFPELAESKESENERIREEIIAFLMYYHTGQGNSVKYDDCWIAWLEKQGEQKPQGKSALEAAKEVKVDNQNCVKPADKVEPKFKVGDLITNGIFVGRIDEIHARGYHTYFGDHYADVHDIENWHKWTIQDAKLGDLLADDYGIYIFDRFDECDERCFLCMGAYQYSQKVYENGYMLCSVEVHPATKEQRDLLFQNMKEAGYEWNAEKKELNKIEPKQEWSEEDENHVKSILSTIECCKAQFPNAQAVVEAYNADIEWLNSIRPQINVTDEELSQAKKDAYNDVLDKLEYDSENPTFDDGWSAAIWYLKKRNAQPQSQWKPSDEQMDALRYVTNFDYGGHKATLVSLYEQLKKLREE